MFYLHGIKVKYFCFLLLLLLFTTTICRASESINIETYDAEVDREYVDEQVVVHFVDDATEEEIEAIRNKFRADQVDSNHGSHLWQLPVETDIEEIISALELDQSVYYAEPNYLLKYPIESKEAIEETTIEKPGGNNTSRSRVGGTKYTDEFYPAQWGLKMIKAEESWGIWERESKQDTEVILAIVDSGVLASHPDLNNRMAINPTTGDVVSHVSTGQNNLLLDSHGTSVAGIAAAAINGRGIIGVAGPANVKILPVRVFESQQTATSLSSIYWIANGIKWAANNKADIINLSLGMWVKSRELDEAVQYAVSKKILLVAAAENKAVLEQGDYPICSPNVLGVTSVNESGLPVRNAGYGVMAVDVAAPGENIIIPTISPYCYKFVSGTSFATAYVSGLAALIKATYPECTADEIVRIIKESTTTPSENWDNNYGSGIINAANALDYGKEVIRQDSLASEHYYTAAEISGGIPLAFGTSFQSFYGVSSIFANYVPTNYGADVTSSISGYSYSQMVSAGYSAGAGLPNYSSAQIFPGLNASIIKTGYWLNTLPVPSPVYGFATASVLLGYYNLSPVPTDFLGVYPVSQY
ncbi:MAG: S8 family serine peptidase [bacterium]